MNLCVDGKFNNLQTYCWKKPTSGSDTLTGLFLFITAVSCQDSRVKWLWESIANVNSVYCIAHNKGNFLDLIKKKKNL